MTEEEKVACEQYYGKDYEPFLHWLESKWIPFELMFSKASVYVYVIVPGMDYLQNTSVSNSDRLKIRFSSHKPDEKRAESLEISIHPHSEQNERDVRFLVLRRYCPLVARYGLAILREFLLHQHEVLKHEVCQHYEKILQNWYYPLVR